MTPAKRVTKPTTAIAPAASHALREQSVPSVTNAAPTQASPRYATRRVRGGPVNSTNTSSANEPKAAKREVCGCPITLSANANTAGITIAARAALLRAATSPNADACRRRSLIRSSTNAVRSRSTTIGQCSHSASAADRLSYSARFELQEVGDERSGAEQGLVALPHPARHG